MAFILTNKDTGEIACRMQAIPLQVGPKKQEFIQAGGEWVETNWVGGEQGALSVKDWMWDKDSEKPVRRVQDN